MTTFTTKNGSVEITNELLLSGLTSARELANSNLPQTIANPDVPNEQIPNPDLFDTDQDYYASVFENISKDDLNKITARALRDYSIRLNKADVSKLPIDPDAPVISESIATPVITSPLTTITSLSYLQRFTDIERKSIYAAAVTNPALMDLIVLTSASPTIDLASKAVIDGINTLANVGLITNERAKIILKA